MLVMQNIEVKTYKVSPLQIFTSLKLYAGVINV